MFNRKNQIQDMDAYVEERLSDYLDGTLNDKEQQIVEAYLATSERARASYESLRYTVNLIKQTPAPVLPRQFTLPVTSLAPVRTSPPWLVWGLRGVAVAATAAFVLLLTTTLLRQNNPQQAAQVMPMAAAQASPSAMIAMAPTPLPTFSAALQQDQDNARKAVTSAPVMITIQPPADTPAPAPVTVTTEDTANNAQPTSLPAAAVQDTIPPPAAAQEPTVSFNSELARPTPTEIRETTAGTAAGSAAPTQNTPVSAPEASSTASESSTQRSVIVTGIEGVITATRLRVRSGPGVEYPAIGGLRNGDLVKIIGRDTSGSWLVIEFPQDVETGIGWIGALFVDENLPVSTLPIYDAPQPVQPENEPTGQARSPTETATEVPTPQPTPTETATDVPTKEPTSESGAPIVPVEPTATPEE
jgi:hypothetical protein